MYPFPPREKLLFLLEGNPTLTQILVNPYDVHLQLDNGCVIVAEHIVTHRRPSGLETAHGAHWKDAPPIEFHALLETPLLDIEVEPLVLGLVFEGGHRLLVHSHEGPYECGNINGPEAGFLF